MRKTILILSLLIVSSAVAGELDDVVKKINHDLNPQRDGDTGWEVEYRQDNRDVWINILRVKRDCGPTKPSFHIKNHRLVNAKLGQCFNRAYAFGKDDSLFQVLCNTSKGQRCMSNLAREVNTAVIKDMITRKINDAYVE